MVAAGKQIRMATMVINGNEPNHLSNKIALSVGTTIIRREGSKSLRQSIRAVAITTAWSLSPTLYSYQIVARIITVDFLIAQIFTCELDTSFRISFTSYPYG